MLSVENYFGRDSFLDTEQLAFPISFTLDSVGNATGWICYSAKLRGRF